MPVYHGDGPPNIDEIFPDSSKNPAKDGASKGDFDIDDWVCEVNEKPQPPSSGE